MPVSVNVKMTAENKSEIPTMTKFQQSLPPSFQAAMYSVDVEPSHKVMDLKKKVAMQTMMFPEKLMYAGVEMEDNKKLSDYGISRSMGMYDYVWVDSEENQSAFAAHKQHHVGDLKTKYHYLREKFAGSCWSF